MLKYLRLFVLLLLGAGLSHQLNAAPTHNAKGQSAIQISVAYFQPAAIAILDAPDLQTADLSPDIGYKQNSNATVLKVAANMSLEVAEYLIKPNSTNSNANFEGRYKYSTAGTHNDSGARMQSAKKNNEGVRNATNVIWYDQNGGNSATTANTTTATDDDSGQCLDQNAAAATTTWTTGYYDDAGNLNATATTSAHDHFLLC